MLRLTAALLLTACVFSANAQEVAPDAQSVAMADFCQDATHETPFYPVRALQRGLNGEATLDCTLAEDDTLATCQVIRESPAGFGFGRAALRVACHWTPGNQHIAAQAPDEPTPRHILQTIRFDADNSTSRQVEHGSITN